MASAFELLLLAQQAQWAAAWTSYSPSWAASSSSPSIGNGAIAGSYIKIGRTVTANITFWGGSTTTWGSGYYSLGLPFTAATTGVPVGGIVATGSLSAIVAGTPTFWAMNSVIFQNTPGVINGFANPSSGSFWASTNPASFGTTSSFVATITYQSAS